MRDILENIDHLDPGQIFEKIMILFRRKYSESNDILRANGKKGNFIGGVNDKRRTLHELIYSFICPVYQEQVSFGTGKDGLKKYGTKKFVVDFYDPMNKYIIEIDGDNHKGSDVEIIYDGLRDQFFKDVYGIETVRLSNNYVEKLLMRHIQKQCEAGRRDWIVAGLKAYFFQNTEYWMAIEEERLKYKNMTYQLFLKEKSPSQ